MILPASTGVTRGCRRSCMGCDPCWICRRSYPASVTLTANSTGTGGGSSSGGGPNPAWGLCCGHLAGTYVPATPYGQDVDFDNGVTLHRTFKAPYTILGSTFPSCGANWEFKTSDFLQGYKQDIFGVCNVPVYQNGVWRCQGANTDPIVYNDPTGWCSADINRPYVVEYLQDASVQLAVGGWPFSSATVAADADSTRVDCYISERFRGYTSFNASGSSYPTGFAYYEVVRNVRYSVWLSKPCPTTGTFTLTRFGTTFIPIYLASTYSTGPLIGDTITDFASYPDCVSEVDPYTVDITL